MGSDDPVSVDEEVEDSIAVDAARVRSFAIARNSFKPDLIVVLIAAAIFLGCAFSPPHLMDDVDAVQAQIARNMLQSGDWVTARLDGIAYLEKSPLIYWIMAVAFRSPSLTSLFAGSLRGLPCGRLAAAPASTPAPSSPPASESSSSPAFSFP